VAARYAAVEVLVVEAHHVAVDVHVNESLNKERSRDVSGNDFFVEHNNNIITNKRRGVP
jgi:hypothetical protein